MKIYTRTGDKGLTSLFGGKRVSKSSLRVEAYGTIDELNSAIGIAIAEISNFSSRARLDSRLDSIDPRRTAKRGEAGKSPISNVKKELEGIQNDLFTIGSYLASPGIHNSEFRVQNLRKRVEAFEELIDQLTEKVPELRNFISPGGGRAGAQLHFSRTVCRRTERRIVALSQKEHVSNEVLIYFNRLSDLLFTMARYINMKEKQKETIWKKP